MKTISSKLILPFLLILGTLTLNSCKKEQLNTEQQKLDFARETWKGHNISDYSFKVSLSCFCADLSPYEVTVTNKTITSVKNSQGQEIQFSDKGFRTIDEMFQYIETSLAKDPYQSVINYDPTYRFPASIYFDFDQHLADEEIGYQITDFKRK